MKKLQKFWLLLCCLLAVPSLHAEEKETQEEKNALKLTGGFKLRALYDVGYYEAQPGLMPSAIPLMENGDKRQNVHFDIFGAGLGLQKGFPVGQRNIKFAVDSGLSTKGIKLKRLYIDHDYFRLGLAITNFCDVAAAPNTLTGDVPGSLAFDNTVQACWKQQLTEGLSYTVAAEKSLPLDLYPGVKDEDKKKKDWASKGDLPVATANVCYKKKFGHIQLSGLFRVMDIYTNKTDEALTYMPAGGAILSTAINIIPEMTILKLYGIYGMGIGSYLIYTAGYPEKSKETKDMHFENDNEQELLHIQTWGGYVGIEHRWLKQLRSTVVYGYTNVNNHFGRGADAFHQGHFISGNLAYHFTDHLSVGAEYICGIRTLIRNDYADTNAHRIQGTVAFKL